MLRTQKRLSEFSEHLRNIPTKPLNFQVHRKKNYSTLNMAILWLKILVIREQHQLFNNQFTVGNSECCKISYHSNSLQLSSSTTQQQNPMPLWFHFQSPKDIITARQWRFQSCLPVHRRKGRGVIYVQVLPLVPCIQGLAPHVQDDGPSSFCTGPHP